MHNVPRVEPFSSSQQAIGPDSMSYAGTNGWDDRWEREAESWASERPIADSSFFLERYEYTWKDEINRGNLVFLDLERWVHLLVVSLNSSAQSIVARCANARHSCSQPRLELSQFMQIWLDHHMLKVSVAQPCRLLLFLFLSFLETFPGFCFANFHILQSWGRFSFLCLLSLLAAGAFRWGSRSWWEWERRRIMLKVSLVVYISSFRVVSKIVRGF